MINQAKRNIVLHCNMSDIFLLEGDYLDVICGYKDRGSGCVSFGYLVIVRFYKGYEDIPDYLYCSINDGCINDIEEYIKDGSII